MIQIDDAFPLSIGQEKRLRNSLLDKGFNLFFNGIYVFDEETTQRNPKACLGYRVHQPIGRINDHFLFLEDVKKGFEGFRTVLEREYVSTI